MSQQRRFKLQTAPGYRHLEPFLLELPERFNATADSIHSARNVLKIIEANELNLVVKSFQVLHPARRFIYSYLRSSKACRSFENSRRLLDFGISTPEPVAYIEFFENGLLYDSYYVSRKVDYDFTIREALNAPESPPGKALQACAQFAAKMHNTGILHHDFSPGNLLIKQDSDRFILYLVDVNRMDFQAVSPDRGLANLVRMLEKPQARSQFIEHYARARGMQPAKALAKINKLADRYSHRRQLKQKLKKLIKRK